MKKIAVLILSAMMLFAIAASSLANSVSLGYLVNGEDKIEKDGSSFKCNAKNIIIGGNFDISDKISVSGELTHCELKGGDFWDDETLNFYSYKLKGSYAILKNEQMRLDLSAGYSYQEEAEQHFVGEQDKLKYSTFIIGTDATYDLAENMNITAGFEYGLSPKVKDVDGNKADADVLNYQVAFNYYITPKVGLSLGYRSSCWDVENSIKQTIAGIVTSVTYKF